MKKLMYVFVCLLLCFTAGAQELNARVTINSDKVQGTNKQVFTTLQTALTEFINNRRWTDATFAVNERIDCTFTFIINENRNTVKRKSRSKKEKFRPKAKRKEI